MPLPHMQEVSLPLRPPLQKLLLKPLLQLPKSRQKPRPLNEKQRSSLHGQILLQQ